MIIVTGRRNKQELAGGVGHGKPYRILGTALGRLRKNGSPFCPLSDGRTTAGIPQFLFEGRCSIQLSYRCLEGIVKDVQKNPSSADAEPVGETCHSNCRYLFAPLAVTRTDMLPDAPPSGGGLKTEILTVRSP